MRLKRVAIENYRAIETLNLPLDPNLTVLHGDNAHGKTSVLGAITTGLGMIPTFLPEVSGVGFRRTDRRGLQPVRVGLTTTNGVLWERRAGDPSRRPSSTRDLREAMEAIVKADRNGAEPIDLPIVAFYDTDRAVFDPPQRRRDFRPIFPATKRSRARFPPAPISGISSNGSTPKRARSSGRRGNGWTSATGCMTWRRCAGRFKRWFPERPTPASSCVRFVLSSRSSRMKAVRSISELTN